MIGYGVVEPRGEFRYDPVRDDAVLHWSQAYDAPLTAAIHARIRSILGGGPVTGPVSNPLLDTTLLDSATYHPLGGATIGDVCDPRGRVLGQRGLYVVDGALVPGSTGACNPSMTIAALAEYAMDGILGRDLGTVF